MNPVNLISTNIRLSAAAIALFCLLSLNNHAQPALDRAWEELIGAEGFAHATLGACVLDAETGELLFSRSHQTSMLTASTMKVFVTRAALDALGSDFRFITPVFYEGSLARMDGDGWSLNGDLVVLGTGDPTTGSRFFSLPHPADEVVSMLSTANIQSVSGNLVVDESAFAGPSTAGSVAIEDAGNYYGTGIHAFNYADNSVKITFRSTEVGKPVDLVKVQPNAAKVLYTSEVLAAAGGGDQAYIHSGPYQLNPTVYGSIPSNEVAFDIRGAMPHPALEFLHELKKRLLAAGIRFEGELVVRRTPPSAEGEKKNTTQKLGELRSPRLAEIVEVTNRESNNLFAGGLFRALDRSLPSQFSEANEAVKGWLRANGLSDKGFFCADGSGLSRLNRATPFQLASAMRTITDEPTEKAFAASLKPLAQHTAIVVKSGYIQGVRSYCGRAIMANGRRVSFAVVVNHYDCSPSRARKLLQEWMAHIPKP